MWNRALSVGSLVLLSLSAGIAQQQGVSAPMQEGAAPSNASSTYMATIKPLLSLDSLGFLEGTWTAESTDRNVKLGSYSFTRELDGHLLYRRGSGDVNCSIQNSFGCDHRDLFFVYQESPGAPLKAMYFDAEGRVIRYELEIRREELVAKMGVREFAIFSSDRSQLGPRYRLTYERNTDTRTGNTALKGKSEVLMANGVWHTYLSWSGRKQ